MSRPTAGPEGTTHLLSIVCLSLLLTTAGCMVPYFDQPIKQEQPVTLIVNNSANTTQTFEASVVQLPANVTYRLNDGRVGTHSIGEGVGSVNSGDNQTYTSVELPESARLHGRFTLEPGQSNRSAIANLPWNFAVVVVVYQHENNATSFVVANCDDLALVALRVTSYEDHVSITHSCQEPR